MNHASRGLVIGAMIVGVVVFSAYLFTRADGLFKAGNPELTGEDQQFGAVSALNSPLEVNGTREYRQGTGLRTGTSTVCTFGPVNATTTGTIKVKIRTMPYAFGYQIAYGLVKTATTTNLGFIFDPSTSIGVASSTNVLIPPNTYVNVRVATATTATVDANFAPTGTCVYDLFE